MSHRSARVPAEDEAKNAWCMANSQNEARFDGAAGMLQVE